MGKTAQKESFEAKPPRAGERVMQHRKKRAKLESRESQRALRRNRGLARVQNRAERMDHAKHEIVAARFFEIPAAAVAAAAMKQEGGR